MRAYACTLRREHWSDGDAPEDRNMVVSVDSADLQYVFNQQIKGAVAMQPVTRLHVFKH